MFNVHPEKQETANISGGCVPNYMLINTCGVKYASILSHGTVICVTPLAELNLHLIFVMLCYYLVLSIAIQKLNGIQFYHVTYS